MMLSNKLTSGKIKNQVNYKSSAEKLKNDQKSHLNSAKTKSPIIASHCNSDCYFIQ